MSKSINDDVTNTLSKLTVLLEYSTHANADEVLQLVSRAKTIWDNGEEEQDTEE